MRERLNRFAIGGCCSCACWPLLRLTAFAQPTWFEGEEQSLASSTAGHTISIYVDNSLSMEGMGEEGQLLQSARNKASLVVEQYEPTDQFQVLTNDFSGRDQTFLTRDQAVERIEGIRPTNRSQTLVSVLERIENQLEKAPNRRRSAYVFSDLKPLPIGCRSKLHRQTHPSNGFCAGVGCELAQHLGRLGGSMNSSASKVGRRLCMCGW